VTTRRNPFRFLQQRESKQNIIGCGEKRSIFHPSSRSP